MCSQRCSFLGRTVERHATLFSTGCDFRPWGSSFMTLSDRGYGRSPEQLLDYNYMSFGFQLNILGQIHLRWGKTVDCSRTKNPPY